jgi:retron-type reverse transcriptase
MLRLYTNILAKRVTKGVPLNPRQRGFIEAPGCSENGFLLQRIQKHAKRNRKRLSVVFLDLAKAFDTVSHKHISEGLKRFRVNSHFIDAVVDLYTDASTHFTLAKGETPKIPMTRGVKQGDPLSPLLFNVAMDPLLEAISAQNNGYKWDESGLQLEALCYADDKGLLTEDPKEMQSNLDVVNEFCEATGMRLNVKKSAGYDIQPSANRSYIINDFQPK